MEPVKPEIDMSDPPFASCRWTTVMRPGDAFLIGGCVSVARVQVIGVDGKTVRVVVTAPPAVTIQRVEPEPQQEASP